MEYVSEWNKREDEIVSLGGRGDYDNCASLSFGRIDVTNAPPPKVAESARRYGGIEIESDAATSPKSSPNRRHLLSARKLLIAGKHSKSSVVGRYLGASSPSQKCIRLSQATTYSRINSPLLIQQEASSSALPLIRTQTISHWRRHQRR